MFLAFQSCIGKARCFESCSVGVCIGESIHGYEEQITAIVESRNR